MMDNQADAIGDGQTHPGSTAFLITQVGAVAALRFAERLATVDLIPPHAGILRLIGRSSHHSQREVAERLGIQPSRLVAFVDELEELGLLKRRRSETDRRNYELELTKAGTRTLGQIAAIAQANGEQLLECLDEREQAQLAKMLSRVAADAGLGEGIHPGYRQL